MPNSKWNECRVAPCCRVHCDIENDTATIKSRTEKQKAVGRRQEAQAERPALFLLCFCALFVAFSNPCNLRNLRIRFPIEYFMPAGIYIHTPFCRSRCSYCDFATGMHESEAAERYVRALTKEIARWNELDTPETVVTISF